MAHHIDWSAVRAAIRTKISCNHVRLPTSLADEAAKAAKVARYNMYSAANGVPVSADCFMAICTWLNVDPRSFLKDTHRD